VVGVIAELTTLNEIAAATRGSPGKYSACCKGFGALLFHLRQAYFFKACSGDRRNYEGGGVLDIAVKLARY
jgi:hypothetical protein